MPGAAKLVGGVVRGLTGDITSGIDRGTSEQREGYRRAEKRLEPYAATGFDAFKDLYAMAQGDWDFKTDPGYDFRLAEGTKALERSVGGPGGSGRYSGATLKALTRYGQDFASEEYGRAYDRRTGTLRPIAEMGYGAAGGQAGYIAGAGEAGAAGEIAKARVQGDTMSGLFGGIGAGLGAYAAFA